jgi:hypothetical protein
MREKPVRLTSCLLGTFGAAATRASGVPRQPILKLLIRHWFDSGPHKYVKSILHCSICALQHK